MMNKNRKSDPQSRRYPLTVYAPASVGNMSVGFDALGLALFELRIRDALAQTLTEGGSASRRRALVKTAERIMELRRLAPFNLNRTLAFERLLLTRS